MKHYINDKGQIDTNPLYYDGKCVVNPTEQDYLAAGYHEYVPPTPTPYLPTYAELVERYIREHGYPTYGAELAVLNNYAQDPATYAQAYADYMQVRIDAKEWAEEQPHRYSDTD